MVPLILGIISAALCFLGIFIATIPLSIVSIVLGICAIVFGHKQKYTKQGMAGLICGIVSTIIAAIMLIIMLTII